MGNRRIIRFEPKLLRGTDYLPEFSVVWTDSEAGENTQNDYEITIKDTVSGKQKTFTEQFPSDECAEFMFSEGNYACDCNRSIFLQLFDRAELPCNVGENQIVCLGIRNLKTGKIVKESEVENG